MKCLVASVLLCVWLIPAVTVSQTKTKTVKPSPSQTGPLQNSTPKSRTVKICQGLAIPAGYVIVGYVTSSACPNGAYLLREEDTKTQSSEAATSDPPALPLPSARPRRVADAQLDLGRELTFSGSVSDVREPVLLGTELSPTVKAPATDPAATKVEEVAEGDVVRVDTNLVTVP